MMEWSGMKEKLTLYMGWSHEDGLKRPAVKVNTNNIGNSASAQLLTATLSIIHCCNSTAH